MTALAILGIAAAMCFATPGAFAQAAPAAAGSSKAAVAPATPAHAASQPERRPGGTHEGIKVHGRWIIEVKNPDGTLAQRREFENSLSPLQSQLQSLLAGNSVVGGWEISLSASLGATSICTGNGYCVLYQSSVVYPGALNSGNQNPFTCSAAPNVSCNLNVALGNDPNGKYAVIFTGTIQPQQTGSIGVVNTELYTCGPGQISGALTSNSPTNCAAGTFSSGSAGDVQLFTSANLSTPLSGVQPAQTVSVTVYITFQ
ncbi:MAG TPA: hypothetical protein VMD92_01035 [Acidobacteriaceae bacterium]|nr:hypothetical protein [Acidobacteriaceae bacterium]